MALMTASLPAVSPAASASVLNVQARRRAFGLRLVGITTMLAAVTVLALAGLAVFHYLLASGQYRLTALEAEIVEQRELLVDLRFEVQALEGPDSVHKLGSGALGLVRADVPIDLKLNSRHIAVGSLPPADSSVPSGGSWLRIRPLLADAAGRG